ncbi:MAG: alpha/beta hydrolase [Treponema sp.]
MKKKHLIKILVSSVCILLAIVVLSTYLIGSYFVDFALVPNSGGEARDSSKMLVQKTMQGYEPLDEDLQIKIAIAQKDDEALYEKWLKTVENNIFPATIQSKEGLKLVGTEMKQENDGNEWVIIVHGYQSFEEKSKRIARHYYNRGFNVLTISLRAHGESEGKYIGMGFLDKDDLFLWTEHIIKEHPNASIVYHGTSMGSATVLFASSLNLPKNVKAIIADCGYTSVWDIFTIELKNKFGLPPFPILYMADIMGRIKAGYSIKNASVLEAVKKSKTPTFFIHTTADDFVPVSCVYALYEACPAKKELYVVKGANHTHAKYVNMDLYYEKIFNFILTLKEDNN